MTFAREFASEQHRLVLPAARSPLTPRPAPGSAPGSGIDRRRDARVLAVSAHGCYLGLGADPPHVVPVLTRDALALPTAVRLALSAGAVNWGVRIGDVVTVGPRTIEFPSVTVRVVRQWTPARVTRLTTTTGWTDIPRPSGPSGPNGPNGPSGPSDRAAGWGGPQAAGAASLHSSVARAVGAADPTDAVLALLGAGRGLTPAGDDALAGALLVLHALGLPSPLPLVVVRHLSRTTALSAALLTAAADGYAVPAVVAHVDAVLRGDLRAAATSRPTVEAIGHSSGRDLLAGVSGALSALSPLRSAS